MAESHKHAKTQWTRLHSPEGSNMSPCSIFKRVGIFIFIAAAAFFDTVFPNTQEQKVAECLRRRAATPSS